MEENVSPPCRTQKINLENKMNSKKLLVFNLVVFWVVCTATTIVRLMTISAMADKVHASMLYSEVGAGLFVGLVFSVMIALAKEYHWETPVAVVGGIAMAAVLLTLPFFTGSLAMSSAAVALTGLFGIAVTIAIPRNRKDIRRWLFQKYAG